jgi:hypothetical protein
MVEVTAKLSNGIIMGFAETIPVKGANNRNENAAGSSLNFGARGRFRCFSDITKERLRHFKRICFTKFLYDLQRLLANQPRQAQSTVLQ